MTLSLSSQPQNASVFVRINSPAASKYIDVPSQEPFHHKIYDQIFSLPTVIELQTVIVRLAHSKRLAIDMLGCLDDLEIYDRWLRHIEMSKVDLHQVAISWEFVRKLVATVRLLFAVG